MFSSTYKVVLSPCVGICVLEADGLCAGCLRTGDEIASWSTMDDAQRLHVMTLVIPAREASRGNDA